MPTCSAGVAARRSGVKPLRVRDLDSAGAPAWDNFVNAHQHGTFFHLSAWRTIFEQALGHRTHYLVAEQDGAVCGVLPLVHVKSLLFGNNLSSLPFSAHAGPLALDADARDALHRAAHERAQALQVGALEYRLPAASGVARVCKDLYANFTKPILADAEANMQAIRSKQRNVIRKGIKNGLVGHRSTVERFYGVYAESVRNLGTPVFPRRLFDAIATTFGDAIEIISAELDGEPVSAAMNFYYRDSVCPYYWGGRHAARNLNGNDFLAFEIMTRAAQRGCTLFDFGRSKRDTGPYQWKLNLGFEASPLFYEYELIRDREMPDINPLNPKYRLFIESWKRLPLPVAGLIGPWLSRNLG
ncbi:MAG: FemAB family PEP-CTERM system-associated protein [Proteobacteria bacterium]|nr:FemAB family PEP-CTERM system-associated protein [Pseudomonadota bacterium]